ncbi:MAG: hypothetical protein Q9173_002881 [Seirophora scorigena]
MCVSQWPRWKSNELTSACEVARSFRDKNASLGEVPGSATLLGFTNPVLDSNTFAVDIRPHSTNDHQSRRASCNLLPTKLQYMAHRIITQAVVVGARVFGRAFAEAYRQASASSKYAQSSIPNSGSPTSKNLISSGLTLDEACKILNVKPPQGGSANVEEVMDRFKRLFDANDPTKGGSFYLQSKILRARERIELEVREAQEAAETEAEIKEGWKPKIWKDR